MLTRRRGKSRTTARFTNLRSPEFCVVLHYTSRLVRSRTKGDSDEDWHKIVIRKRNGRKTTRRLDHKNKMAVKKVSECVEWIGLS